MYKRQVARRSGSSEEVVGDTEVLRGEQCPTESGESRLWLLGIEAQLGELARRLDDGDLHLAHQSVVEGPTVPAFRHAGEERPADEVEGRRQERSCSIWRLCTSEGHFCLKQMCIRDSYRTV